MKSSQARRPDAGRLSFSVGRETMRLLTNTDRDIFLRMFEDVDRKPKRAAAPSG